MSRDLRVEALKFHNSPLACEGRFLLAGAAFGLLFVLLIIVKGL